MLIRTEAPADIAAIHAVHAAAFPTPLEAQLLDALRAAGRLTVSVVAEVEGRVVGHVAFSPVTIDGVGGGLGLAPLAVVPERQREGIGGALIRAGLEAATAAEAAFVVVLGHPPYYPRFGFRQGSTLGLGNEYGADDAFMVVELRPGGVPTGGGLVRYAPEFAAFGE